MVQRLGLVAPRGKCACRGAAFEFDGGLSGNTTPPGGNGSMLDGLLHVFADRVSRKTITPTSYRLRCFVLPKLFIDHTTISDLNQARKFICAEKPAMSVIQPLSFTNAKCARIPVREDAACRVGKQARE